MKTLNVAKDLRLRGSYPQGLRIKRKKVGNLLAQYLPEEEDDEREGKGLTKRGRNQRTQERCPKERRMGTLDPYEAGRRALEWVLEYQRKSRAKADEEAQQTHSLWGSTGNAGSPRRAESGRELEAKCAGKGMSP